MGFMPDLNLIRDFRIRLNLAAALIFIFNISNPELAMASIYPIDDNAETIISTHPANRLVRPAQKPKIIKGVITAYTSTPDQTDGDPFTTASGKKVEIGTIAANGVPFGTVIKIPEIFGEQRFVVTDRMNSRYKFGRFDVWLPSDRDEAIRFGAKRATVEIYYPENI